MTPEQTVLSILKCYTDTIGVPSGQFREVVAAVEKLAARPHDDATAIPVAHGLTGYGL